MKRIFIVMDVTEDEAKVLGEHLDELGPEYKGYGVKQAIAEALSQFPDAEHLHASVRSSASAAIGGPETPNFKQRDDK